MKTKRYARALLVFLVVFLNVGCDQISKEAARKNLQEKEVVSIVKDNFILTKVENKGAAMSMGSTMNPTLKLIVLKIIPIIILLGLFGIAIRKKDVTVISSVALAFIIGGGIGNIYDRFLYNSVTDFMHIDLGGVFKTGIFNMADVSVVVGTLLILTHALFTYKKQAKVTSEEK